MVIRPFEDSGAVIIVDGRIKSANKGSRNEIKNVSDWLEGFFNYCTIVEILCQPPLRLAVATRIFAQKVLYLSAKHQWSQVRGWAISHHSSAIQKGKLDPSNWVVDRGELWNFCNDDTRISLRTSTSNNPKTGSASAKKTEISRIGTPHYALKTLANGFINALAVRALTSHQTAPKHEDTERHW